MYPANSALHSIFMSVRDRIPGCSFADFEKAYAGWDVVPLDMNGETVGAVLIKANEIHVGYEKLPRASIRSHIRKTINALITKFGHVVTKVSKENERGLVFCWRLGFSITGEEVDTYVMRCERTNYV